ncbi:hypothetical protein PL8927_140115 [Planktothrix serta PCC 8927]|uniref:Uncharacterized protein n=1 Tax=Planktothrix serta PCC 8927 TaxID=671068 RepID=A0A7Z9DXJ7_9CYAN|nr:hypothetical protein [Planktothrix serta]VXD11350.1 hypothetical protein PL8927_140115 [Planktothrix serta PCC 8927]
MAVLQIPDRYIPGLQLIATLDKKVVESVLKAVAESKPSLKNKEIATEVSKVVPEIDPQNVYQIILALASIYDLREYTQYDNDKLSEDLSESIITDLEDLSFEQQQQLKELILKALNLLEGTLGSTSKARILLSEYERLYLKAKIITDVRPIFKEELSDSVEGTLIIHLLKLNYLDKSGEKEFFIALDESDLKELEEQVKKAQEQKKSLLSVIEKAGIPYFIS